MTEERTAETMAMPTDFFESLVAASPDAIITVDTDGEVRYANDAVERLLGFRPAELEGRSAAAVVPPRFRERFAELAREYLETGRQPINWDGAELLAATADGEELPVSVSVVEHRADGDLVFSFVLRDISRRLERRDADD